MALSKRMLAAGLPSVSALAINGQYVAVPAGVGTTQSGATPITGDINTIGTSSAGNTAFLLPNDAIAGDCIDVMVLSTVTASALVFPSTGGTINGGAANASITMAASTSATFFCTGTNNPGPIWVTSPKTPS